MFLSVKVGRVIVERLKERGVVEVSVKEGRVKE